MTSSFVSRQFTFTIMACLASVVGSQGGLADDDRRELVRLADAVLSEPPQENERYRQFFARYSPEDLKVLRDAKYDSLVLRHAWEKVTSSSSGQPTMSSQEFVRLMEERMKVELPSWWKETAVSFAAGNTNPRGSPRKTYSKALAIDLSADWEGRKTRDNMWRLSRNGFSLQVSATHFPEGKEQLVSNSQLAMAADQSRAFAVWYADFPFPAPKLKCFDLMTGELRWSAAMRSGPRTSHQGRPTQYADCVTNGESVYVVMQTSYEIWVEGFSAENGRKIVRFAAEVGRLP